MLELQVTLTAKRIASTASSMARVSNTFFFLRKAQILTAMRFRMITANNIISMIMVTSPSLRLQR